MDERIQRFQQLVAIPDGCARGRNGYPEAARLVALDYCKDRIAAGDMVWSIAAALGVAPATLSKWAVNHGVDTQRPPPPKVDLGKLVVVKETLRNPHPLVAAAQRGFRNDPVDTQKRLTPGRDALNIKVYKSSVPRALRIMDALIKALVERGHTVAIAGPGSNRTVVRFGVDEVEFELVEKVEGFSRLPTRQERDRASYLLGSDGTIREYRPTGRLELRVVSWAHDGLLRGWRDGTRRRLEDVLDDVVVGLEAWGAYETRTREEREEWNRRWLEARRKEEEEQRRLEEFSRKVDILMDEVERWDKAKRIRAYVAAVEEAAERTGWSHGASPKFDEWLAQATECADNLDPLSRGSSTWLERRP